MVETCDVPRALSAQAWTRGLALSWARASRMETLVCRCCPDPKLPTYLYRDRSSLHFSLKGLFRKLDWAFDDINRKI